MFDLSIIIVSYNTKDFLKDCVESIYKTAKNISFEVIVVDNASSDGSVLEIEKLKSRHENLVLIKNDKNLGFSKANNIGVKKSTGRYVLFLNSDTVVHNLTLEKIVSFMDEQKDAGAATCRVLLPNGKLDDASHRGFPTPWNSFSYFLGLSKIFPKTKIFGGYNLTHLDFSKTHEIDALAGAFMITRRKAGEEVGWWDEDFFFYGEDLDFCYKLKQKGWKVYFVPQISILHYKGVSGGIKRHSKEITTASVKTRKKAQEERFRAMKLFYKKHYEKKYPFFITRLIFLGIFLKKTFS